MNIRRKKYIASKNGKIRTAAQTAAFMLIFTLGSKLFGFVREMVMAGCFGASYITDAYVMSVAIPTMILGGIFAAVETAYMPLLSETIEKEGQERANFFTSETMTLLFFVSIMASIIGFLFSNQIVAILASQFPARTAHLTSVYIKVTFTYLLFISISGVLETYLRYKNIFFVQIIIGYVQNVAIILAIFVGAYYNYYLLILGGLVGYAIRLVSIWYVASNNGFKYNMSFHFWRTSKQILALSLPVFIGSGINQINVFVDKTLAAGLQEGSVSALNYAYILTTLIISLTSAIIVTIIYPKMSRAQALEDYNSFNNMLSAGFDLVCIITVPCSIGAIIYSNEVVQVVYERGAFDTTATVLTQSAFMYYAIGLTFVALNTLLIQAYYSMQDMKTPVLYGAVGVIMNILLNLILIKSMAHNGLALSTSIAAICNTILLYFGLRKKYTKITIIKSSRKLVLVFIFSCIAVYTSKLIYNFIDNTIWMPRMVLLGLVIILAGLIYLILMRIFKFKEINLIKDLIKYKP